MPNGAQKHYRQLLLMEERATIARELHDSLAQVGASLSADPSSRCKHAVPRDNACANHHRLLPRG
ncbi:histidine kinase [Enterobacter chuandaensis]|uniref:histidine kinase n=1 Tax=Enterobacter chuandaensis TaxID=2497875 RepID=UPI00281107D8|nr:histidine kinase [Enterobacter chuandaensis]